MQTVPSKARFIINVAAFALLGLMAALMFASAWDDAITNDEGAHIGAGFSYLRKEDYRLNPEHPPLMKDLGGFPLLLMKLQVDWNHKSWTDDPFGQWDFGQRLIFNSGRDANVITRTAKAPLIVFTVALGWIVFWWTRKHFGGAAALLALFLFVFSPTFLAHGRLVTTDVGASAGFFIGTIGFLRFLTNPTRRNIVLAGLAMGFAFLTKFSTVMLIPIALLLAALWVLVNVERGNRGACLKLYLTRTIGIVAIAFLTIYPFYLHHTLKYPPQRQRKDTAFTLTFNEVNGLPKDIVLWASDKPVLRPWAEYFVGLLATLHRSATGNSPFFLGEFPKTGQRLYFPFVYLVKEPLALHLLTIFALVSACFRIWRPSSPREATPLPAENGNPSRGAPIEDPRASGGALSTVFRPELPFQWRAGLREGQHALVTKLAFLVVIAFYCSVAIYSNLNIGVRHILPVFPFIYILVADEVSLYYRRTLGQPASRWGFLLILGALLAWQAVSVVRVHPSYLAYFNEIAGGPDGGWRYVTDSNVDWGQDLKRLSEFVEKRAIPKIHLDYFGGGDPAYYLEEKYQALSSCSEPLKGWVAVSAVSYQESRRNPACDYRRWLPLRKLVTKIGYAIFVFRVD